MIEGPHASHLAAQAGRANPIYLDGKLLPIPVAAARELGLTDGEVVQALVQARGNGDMALLLRGRLLSMPQPSPWREGQSLNLRVLAGPNGAWSLQLLPVGLSLPGVTAPVSLPETAALFSKVANLLYRPAGMAELSQLFRPGVLETMLQTLPRPDLQTQWRGMQLSMALLTPQVISRALAASLGAEARLANGKVALAEDPKLFLRRLMAALREDQVEALDESDASVGETEALQRAVDDVEASQVQAVQAQGQRELLLRMVLPFHDADPVELVFRRAPRNGGQPPPLTVNVHSNSQVLGEIWLRTQLHGSERLELMMWARQADVVRQARDRSAELGLQLREAGLAMQSFQIVHGARPTEAGDWRPSGRGMVVDVSA